MVIRAELIVPELVNAVSTPPVREANLNNPWDKPNPTFGNVKYSTQRVQPVLASKEVK